eukprot:1161513-Pelagomonas_calceolata.AAC.3
MGAALGAAHAGIALGPQTVHKHVSMLPQEHIRQSPQRSCFCQQGTRAFVSKALLHMPALLTKARRYCICQQGARACYQGAARSRVHMGSAVHSPSWITEPTATPHCACTNITRTHTPVDLQQGAALHAIAPPVCRKKQVPAAKEIRMHIRT